MAEAKADPLGARLQGGHAVILPLPASGHIALFFPFARSLARYGVAITFAARAPVCIVSDMFLGFTQGSFRILGSHSSSITYPTLESGPGVQTLIPNRLARSWRSVTGATLEDSAQTDCE
jgi:hypothetical protein